jgi:hypothetical protein
MITQEKLKSVLNLTEGGFVWMVSGSGRHIGKAAGNLRKSGYKTVCIEGRHYPEHHLVWLWHNGELPKEIDHINGNPSDNRIENLRLATRCQNMWNQEARKNNTSGYKNVTWHKAAGKWAAQIRYMGKRKHLGVFSDPADAYDFVTLAAEMLHGQFAGHLRTLAQPR